MLEHRILGLYWSMGVHDFYYAEQLYILVLFDVHLEYDSYLICTSKNKMLVTPNEFILAKQQIIRTGVVNAEVLCDYYIYFCI